MPTSEPRKIELQFIDENVKARADLLFDLAPRTCRFIWKLLKAPLEGNAVHAMWTGREISLTIPERRISRGEGLSIPRENQTVIPLPGDLIWNAYDGFEWQGNPRPVYDFGIFYGRDSRLFLPVGWRPSNRFGVILENLDSFAAVCARCQTEGRKRIRISRFG